MENGTTIQAPVEVQNGTTSPEKTQNKPINDEKAPDSSDNAQLKQKNPKGKKRKKPKDSTAPRHPLTGYVRFLNDRRDAVRATNPALPFAEITKILASEWSNLPVEKKQQYLDAAEVDRERYTREYNAYKETDAYKAFVQQQESQQQEKKVKETAKEETKQAPVPVIKEQTNNNNNIDFPTNFDIPIFTEEFLDHNKTRDAELRQLRKSNTDYEQQNAILQKHIENMKTGIEKLETEIASQKKNSNELKIHLDHLRNTLVSGFVGVKLPGITDVPTVVSIDGFMMNLHGKLLENSAQDATLLATVREIVGRLEFNA